MSEKSVIFYIIHGNKKRNRFFTRKLVTFSLKFFRNLFKNKIALFQQLPYPLERIWKVWIAQRDIEFRCLF